MNAAACRYCKSDTECRGSAWTTNGRDLERFERLHSAERRADLAAARAQRATPSSLAPTEQCSG